MKQIGHIDGATTATAWKTHTLGMLSPHDLFIPNPGERENVSADQWEHIGWVDPDKDGGQIWTYHAEAGDNSRPAYVQREATPTDAVAKLTMSKEYGEIGRPLPSTIPTGQLLSEALAFCTEELDGYADLDGDSEINCTRSAVYIRELVRRFPADPAPSVVADQPMTFYDHAFIHAAVNHADYYSGSTMTQAVIDDAHAVASMLTRNRANKP